MDLQNQHQHLNQKSDQIRFIAKQIFTYEEISFGELVHKQYQIYNLRKTEDKKAKTS